jgi:murein DD-endopeptidase MepM/ murein hydrolase activator NlpD
MDLPYLLQLIYGNRQTIKKVCIALVILVGGFVFFIYLIIVTIFAVIQGQGTVTDQITQTQGDFVEFQSFSYKTVFGEQWYDFNHPYIFPTLGVLTQGVILDQGAVVGQRHIAWDIADRVSRQTEVRAFADGTVIAVKDNTLYGTTRRWQFCDTSGTGICWYVVSQSADVQYGCGNEIDIQHADSLVSQYCHLASVNVQAGDQVTVGQVIGYQGSTGWATGKHLHFALSRNKQPIPPTYAFTQTSLSNWGDGN